MMLPTKQAILLLSVSAFLSGAISAEAAFACPPLGCSSRSRTTSRNLFASPPPMEEREREKEKGEGSSESSWREVAGGFIPKINRRLVREVTSLQDYKESVVQADEELVVVKFYAKWCKSCKAMDPLYKRLAAQHKDRVKFVQVPVGPDTVMIHQGLGVPSVPYGHIYHKEAGLVEELRIKKQNFGNFENVLQTYVDGQCEFPEEGDEGF